MNAYNYIGFDDSGSKVKGEIQAETVEEAERRLSGRQIAVLSLTVVTGGAQHGQDQQRGRGPRMRKVSDADVAMILESWAVMAETGVTFLDGLEASIESARTPAIKATLEQVRLDVVGGMSIATAMRLQRHMFVEVVCDIVKIAEEGGRLDHALRSAATMLERQHDLKKRIGHAMLYPAVMGGVSVITIFILIVFVMPKFAEIFTKMKADVPLTTQYMLLAGNTIRSNPYPVLIGFVLFIALLRPFLRLPMVQMALTQLLWNSPGIGPLLRSLAYSRAFLSIGTLLKSNVPMMSALEHGAKVAGNRKIYDALMDARVHVEHGGSLSEALSSSKLFPKSMVQIVSVGEKTGRLAILLESASMRIENDVDARLKSLVSIVEPVMIVFMGTIVGTITISIISPIYSVVQNIK